MQDKAVFHFPTHFVSKVEWCSVGVWRVAPLGALCRFPHRAAAALLALHANYIRRPRSNVPSNIYKTFSFILLRRTFFFFKGLARLR